MFRLIKPKRKRKIKKNNISLPKSKSKFTKNTLVKLEIEINGLEETYKKNRRLLTKAIQDNKKALAEQKKLIKNSNSNNNSNNNSKSDSNKTLYKKSNSKSDSNKTLYKKSKSD